MKCPYCQQQMQEGFLSSRSPVFWSEEVSGLPLPARREICFWVESWGWLSAPGLTSAGAVKPSLPNINKNSANRMEIGGKIWTTTRPSICPRPTSHAGGPAQAGAGNAQPVEEAGRLRGAAEKEPGKPRFSLHDGPPFSNGNLHMGHALNKSLKDFITRMYAMRGYYTPYIPGWDNHACPSRAPSSRSRGSTASR